MGLEFERLAPKREEEGGDARENAQRMLSIAETVGDIIDIRIRKLLAEGRCSPYEITQAADDARRTIFDRGCDVLGIDKSARDAVLER